MTGHNSHPSVCGWFLKHLCRCSKLYKSGVRRGVDSVCQSFPGASTLLASDGGSVRHQSQPQAPSVLFTGGESNGFGSGRVASFLGWSDGLRLSPFQHGVSGPSQALLKPSGEDDSDRPILATEGLVSRPGFSVRGTGVTTFESRST